MDRWFNPKLLAAAFALMLLIQGLRLNRLGITSETFSEALGAVLVGGYFWGFVFTYIQRKFFSKR